MEGRRVLVYITHTGMRETTGRMDDILTRHGFRMVVMKAVAVVPRGAGRGSSAAPERPNLRAFWP